jgi:hypothetical protein
MLEAVQQWAFTLVITAVVGGLANAIAISDSGGMKKYVKFACAAVALAVMIMPIRELFKEMPQLFDFDFAAAADAYADSEIFETGAQYNERLNILTVAKTDELLKRRISDIVYEKTGIKPDGVYIYIRQKDYSEIEIEKIVIYTSENHEETALYLRQLFNCEVEVETEIGEKIND